MVVPQFITKPSLQQNVTFILQLEIYHFNLENTLNKLFFS